jgi:hypothetical protein
MNHRCIFFLVLINCLGIYSSSSFVSASQTAEYGNKYKDLMRLQSIVADIPGVCIPEFIGISSDRIEAFLKEHAPHITEQYQSLINNDKKAL